MPEQTQADRDIALQRDINGRMPITPHEEVAEVDCCGCLIAPVSGDQVSIICNECGDLIRTVSVAEVKAVIAELSMVDVICSATCSGCGQLNTFPPFSSDAFVSKFCGEGQEVETTVQ